VDRTPWLILLTQLSQVALTDDDRRDPNMRIFSLETRAQGYLGCAGATEEQIVAAENRLGVRLPASYRTFLSISNGWPMISSEAMPGRLWSVDEIYWIRDHDPHAIKIWGEGNDDISPEEHLKGQDSLNYRKAYVKNLLSISDHGDACDLLLSPEIVDPLGEWECWQIANWYPGAVRYASFQTWITEKLVFLRTCLQEDL